MPALLFVTADAGRLWEAVRGTDTTGLSAQGACGYGYLDKGTWPYWSVAALSTSNSFSKAGPVQGCGCALCACDLRSCSRQGHPHGCTCLGGLCWEVQTGSTVPAGERQAASLLPSVRWQCPCMFSHC